jgi:hypothetical protein
MMEEKRTYVVLWVELLKSDLLEPKIHAGIEIQEYSSKYFEKWIALALDLAL